MKSKGDVYLNMNLITKLLSITCHMGSIFTLFRLLIWWYQFFSKIL